LGGAQGAGCESSLIGGSGNRATERAVEAHYVPGRVPDGAKVSGSGFEGSVQEWLCLGMAVPGHGFRRRGREPEQGSGPGRCLQRHVAVQRKLAATPGRAGACFFGSRTWRGRESDRRAATARSRRAGRSDCGRDSSEDWKRLSRLDCQVVSVNEARDSGIRRSCGV
jgi:hypothetical protein